jgi:type I restriction enzyme M protein
MDNKNIFNMKDIKKEFKKFGVFYTSNDLSLYLKSLIDVNYKNVYDPTCGSGALLKIFDDNIKKYGQEIDKNSLNVATNTLVNFEGMIGDTLIDDKFINYKFDVVIANPPFSINWQPNLINSLDVRFKNLPVLPPQSKADYAFILHCLDKITNDGMAIILNSPGILYRGNKEGQLRKWLIDNNYIDKIISVPGKNFIDTSIATCVIILKKNKTTTNVKFVDSENNISKIITQQEIIKNNYMLNVNNFCAITIKKEHIDPKILAKEINQTLIKAITTELTLNKFIYENFGDGEPLDNIIINIEKVLNEFRRQPKFVF